MATLILRVAVGTLAMWLLCAAFVVPTLGQDATVIVTIRKPVPLLLNTWRTDPSIVTLSVSPTRRIADAKIRVTIENTRSGDKVTTDVSHACMPRFTFEANRPTILNGPQIICTDAFKVDGGLQASVIASGSLPEGDYTFCVEILENDRPIGATGKLCDQFNVTWSDPPGTVSPIEGSVLRCPSPIILAWTPVAPIPAGTLLQYRVRLVGVVEQQEPRVAIETATPAEVVLDGQFSVTSVTILPNDPRIQALLLQRSPRITRFAWQVQAVDVANNRPFDTRGATGGKGPLNTFEYRCGDLRSVVLTTPTPTQRTEVCSPSQPVRLRWQDPTPPTFLAQQDIRYQVLVYPYLDSEGASLSWQQMLARPHFTAQTSATSFDIPWWEMSELLGRMAKASPQYQRLAWVVVTCAKTTQSGKYEPTATMDHELGLSPPWPISYTCSKLSEVFITAPRESDTIEICSTQRSVTLSWSDPTPAELRSGRDIGYQWIVYPFSTGAGTRVEADLRTIVSRPMRTGTTSATSATIASTELMGLLAEANQRGLVNPRLAFVVLTCERETASQEYKPTGTENSDVGMSHFRVLSHACSSGFDLAFVGIPSVNDTLLSCLGQPLKLEWREMTPNIKRDPLTHCYALRLVAYRQGETRDVAMAQINVRPSIELATTSTSIEIPNRQFATMVASMRNASPPYTYIAVQVIHASHQNNTSQATPYPQPAWSTGIDATTILAADTCKPFSRIELTYPVAMARGRICPNEDVVFQWTDPTPATRIRPGTVGYRVTILPLGEDSTAVLSGGQTIIYNAVKNADVGRHPVLRATVAYNPTNNGRHEYRPTSAELQRFEVECQQMSSIQTMVWYVEHVEWPATATVFAHPQYVPPQPRVLIPTSCAQVAGLRLTQPLPGAPVELCPTGSATFRWEDRTTSDVQRSDNLFYELTVVGSEQEIDHTTDAAALWARYLDYDAGKLPGFRTHLRAASSSGITREFVLHSADMRRLDSLFRRWPNIINGLVWGIVPLAQTTAANGTVTYGTPSAGVNANAIEFRGHPIAFCPSAPDTNERNPAHRPMLRTPADSTELWCLGPTTLSWEAPLELPTNVAATDEMAFRVVLFAKPATTTTKDLVALRPGSTEPAGTMLWDDVLPLSQTSLEVSAQFFTMQSIASKLSTPGTDVAWTVYLVSRTRNSRTPTITRVWGIGEKPTAVSMGGGQRMRIQLSGGDDALVLQYRCSGTAMRFIAPAHQQELPCTDASELRWTRPSSPSAINGGQPFGYRVSLVKIGDNEDAGDVYAQRLAIETNSPDVSITIAAATAPDTTAILDKIARDVLNPKTGSQTVLWTVHPIVGSTDEDSRIIGGPVRDAGNGNMPWRTFTLSCTVSPRAPRLIAPSPGANVACEADSLALEWKGDFSEATLKARRYAYRVSLLAVPSGGNVLDVLAGTIAAPTVRRITTAERFVLAKADVVAFAESLTRWPTTLSQTVVWYVELVHNDTTVPMPQRKGVATSDGRLGRSEGGRLAFDCLGITPPVLMMPDDSTLACGSNYTFVWSPASPIPASVKGIGYQYEWLLMGMRPDDDIESMVAIRKAQNNTDELAGPVLLRKRLNITEQSFTLTADNLNSGDVFRRAALLGYTRVAWTVVLRRIDANTDVDDDRIVARGVTSMQRLSPKPSAMTMKVRCDRSSSFTLLVPSHNTELPCSTATSFRWTKASGVSGGQYFLVFWALRPGQTVQSRGGMGLDAVPTNEALLRIPVGSGLADTTFTMQAASMEQLVERLGTTYDRVGWAVVVAITNDADATVAARIEERATGGVGLPMGREFSFACSPKPPRFTAPMAHAVADCGGPSIISWKGASNLDGGTSDATVLTIVALGANDDAQVTLDTAKAGRLISKVLYVNSQTTQYQFTASERARLDSMWFNHTPKIVRFAMQLTPVSTANPSATFESPNDAKGRSEIRTFTMSCIGKGVRPLILQPSDSASVSCTPGQGIVSWTSAMVSVSTANSRYRVRCVALPDGVAPTEAAMQQASLVVFDELVPGDTTQYVMTEAQRKRCDSLILSSSVPIGRFALQVQITSMLSGTPQPVATVGDPLGRSPIVTFTWQCKPITTAECVQIEPATPEYKETIVGSPRVAFSLRIRPDVKPTAIRTVRLRVWSMQSFTESPAMVKARPALFDATSQHTQSGAFMFDADKAGGATILRLNGINGTAPVQATFDAQPNTTYLWVAEVRYDSVAVRADGRACGRSVVSSSDGMFLYRGPDCNTIATVPAPTNRTPFTGVLKVGDTIRVGLFTARLTKVGGSAAALTGEAVVSVPLFRAGVEVAFAGLSVNAQKQVTGGEMKGKRTVNVPGGADAVDHLAQAFMTDTATVSMWMGLANDAGRLVSGLSPDGPPMTLPIGIDRVVDGKRIVVGVVDVVFRPTGAKLTAGVQVDLPNTGTTSKLSLGARDLAFSPEGLAQDFELGLLVPLDVPLGDTTLMMRVHARTASEPVGTYAKIGCKGFEYVEMGASVTFPTSWLLRSATDRKPVTATVAGRVRASGEFIIGGSMGRSVFADAEEFGLDTFMLTMDMSDKDNPPGIVFPEDYVGTRTAAWRGFHASQLMVRLPDQFRQFSGDRAPGVGVRNLIIDRTGVTMQARAVNLMQYPQVNFGDWGASLDTVGIDMANSALTRGMIAGRLKLPVSDSALLYHGVVGRTPGKPGSVSYAFSIGVKDSINMRLWTATATLNKASHLSVMGTTAKPFTLVANLSGSISFGTPQSGSGKNIPIELGGMRFEELKVQTHQMPYLSIKAVAFASPPHSMLAPQPQKEAVGANARRAVGGFPISITKLELATRQNDAGQPGAGIRFGVAVNLQPGNNAISGGTTLSVWGALKKQPDKPVSFEYDETLLDSVGVTADLGAVAIEGYVRLYNADPTYGNGFKGAVRASFAKMVEAEAVAQFGAKNDYRYWYVDANVKIAAGIPVFAGVGIYGFGGGAWYNMKRVVDTTREKELAKPASSDLLSNLAGGVQAPPGAANSAATYIPDNGGGAGAWGLAAMVTLGTHPSPDAFNCDLRLSAGFVGQGIDFINFRGDGWMLAGLMERQKAKIRMWANIDYNFPTSTFNGNFGVSGDLGVANFSGNMLMHFSPQKWFVKIGDPYAQRVQIQLLKILKVNAYIMAGMQLPPPPPLPKEVLDLVGAVPAAIRPGALSTGDGFAFGAEADLNTGDLQFLFFYARIRLLLGFDMALLNFGPNATCGDGSPLGDNGWYAMGQLYAMAEAAVGIKVDVGFIQGQFEILSLKAGVALQGGLPKPTWLAGAVGGQYNILGGLIRGRCNFQFKVGDECRLPTESALATATMISSLAPANGAKDVPLWDEPLAIFNLPVNQPFELEEMLDSITTVTRIYRVQMNRFDVGEEHRTNTFAKLNARTNVQNASDGVLATLRPDALYKETTKHRVTITAYGQRFKLGYSSKALATIRAVSTTSAAQVEQWAQQAMAVDSNWEDVRYETGTRKGQRVEQTITNDFTTAAYTDTLSPQEVVASYPRDRQRNFLAGQCATGDINLVRNRLDLFSQRDPAVVRSWIARFVPLDGGPALETAVQYSATAPILARGQVPGSGATWNSSGGRISFGIPQLRSQTTYALQIIRKDSLKQQPPPPTQPAPGYMITDKGAPTLAGGAMLANDARIVRGDNTLEVVAGRIPSGFEAARAVGANEHLLYMMVFRTSQFATMQQKLAALTYTDVRASTPFLNAQQLLASLQGSEGFDTWDVGTQSVVRSGLTYDIGPLVRVSATGLNDAWHTTFVRPRIYDEIDYFEQMWSKRYDVQLRNERERGNTFIQIDNVDVPLNDHEVSISTNGAMARVYEQYRRSTPQALQTSLSSVSSVRQTSSASLSLGTSTMGLAQQPVQQTLRYMAPVYTPFDFGLVRSIAAQQLQYTTSGPLYQRYRNIINTAYQLPTFGSYTVQYQYVPTACTAFSAPLPVGKPFTLSPWGQR